MQLRLYQYDLPLRHVFTIARGSIRIQKTVIVELEEDGVRGYGEATVDRYYHSSLETLTASLSQVRGLLATRQLDDPAQLWQELDPVLGHNRFAQCALDQAAHDLWGKKRGQPVYRLWGLTAENLPPTNYTIGIDEVPVMIAKIHERPNWPVYKIKLGTDHDLEIVRALRAETGSRFRVDANCGWTAAETLRNAAELAKLDVEFIEQPLPAEDWEAMRQVYQNSALPLIADESCVVEKDVERCAGHFHGVNIKLVKCGGLTPARRMIDRARQLGLKVMVGCMTESSVGISAIAQLLPLLDYVDMDGALLLAEDLADGVTIDQGYCRYPERPGCGVELVRTGMPIREF